MLILVSKPILHEKVGYLASPTRTAIPDGVPWAADNDCYGGHFDAGKYRSLMRIDAGGCLFLNAPDVLADSGETLGLFSKWHDSVRSSGFPVALVTQDGMIPTGMPWDDIDAIFVGGSTEWKLSEASYNLIREGSARGKHVHMGRVNSPKRVRLAMSWGVDSVDGSLTARFTDLKLPQQIEASREDIRVITAYDRRVCTLCGVEKPFSEFTKDRRRPHGIGGKCLPCKSIATRLSQISHKETASE